MVRDSMETETLARLYFDQGHPERAVRIYERILSRDPGCSSAVEGLARCRDAMQGRRARNGMDREKKLNILKLLLSRLTGEAMPRKPVEVRPAVERPLPVAEPVHAAPPPPPPARPADPRKRRLIILQAMLQRLTEA